MIPDKQVCKYRVEFRVAYITTIVGQTPPIGVGGYADAVVRKSTIYRPRITISFTVSLDMQSYSTY
jgi:hypothetical protein